MIFPPRKRLLRVLRATFPLPVLVAPFLDGSRGDCLVGSSPTLAPKLKPLPNVKESQQTPL